MIRDLYKHIINMYIPLTRWVDGGWDVPAYKGEIKKENVTVKTVFLLTNNLILSFLNFHIFIFISFNLLSIIYVVTILCQIVCTYQLSVLLLWIFGFYNNWYNWFFTSNYIASPYFLTYNKVATKISTK